MAFPLLFSGSMMSLKSAVLGAALLALTAAHSGATLLECSEGSAAPPPAKGAATNLSIGLDGNLPICYANPESAAAPEANRSQTVAILSAACLGLFALRRSRRG